MDTRIEINAETGEEIVITLTSEETETREAQIKADEVTKAKQETQLAKDKAAILSKLGITAEEAILLLS
jgi:hypothetical protein